MKPLIIALFLTAVGAFAGTKATPHVPRAASTGVCTSQFPTGPAFDAMVDAYAQLLEAVGLPQQEAYVIAYQVLSQVRDTTQYACSELTAAR